jgi:predicted porin
MTRIVLTTTNGLLGAAAIFAVATVATLAPARAADLGGDCCADLEERVAELEATTVRKGNRKISLQLYGHLNQAIMFWDDGNRSDTYIGSNAMSIDRFGFKGDGKVGGGNTVGFRLELAAGVRQLSQQSDNFGFTAAGAAIVDNISIRQEYVFLKNDSLGTLSLGQQSSSNDGIMELDVSGPAKEAGFNNENGDLYVGGFRVFDGVAGAYTSATWTGLFNSGDGKRQELIRYDSPALAGFTLSADWGEDDAYGAALRYSNDNLSGFKVLFGFGYASNTTSSTTETETWGGSLGVRHLASGLFLQGSYADIDRNIDGRDNTTNVYVKGGIGLKLSSLGETAFYGEYDVTENQLRNDSRGEFWGLGVGQALDPVGATIYLGYRHFTADLAVPAGLGANPEDMDAVIGGMKVPF